MALTNETSQYLSVLHTGEDKAKLVKRIHYVTFVGMLRADFFEGLCVGHAPKKCRICGKWFLTTNARHTKYCGGFAPGDQTGTYLPPDRESAGQGAAGACAGSSHQEDIQSDA